MGEEAGRKKLEAAKKMLEEMKKRNDPVDEGAIKKAGPDPATQAQTLIVLIGRLKRRWRHLGSQRRVRKMLKRISPRKPRLRPLRPSHPHTLASSLSYPHTLTP